MTYRKTRLTGSLLALVAAALAATSLSLAQQSRTQRPQPDIKVTYKVSMGAGAGGAMPASESTTMIKGARERSEDHRGYGFDSVSIMQCDLKRTVALNDRSEARRVGKEGRLWRAREQA